MFFTQVKTHSSFRTFHTLSFLESNDVINMKPCFLCTKQAQELKLFREIFYLHELGCPVHLMKGDFNDTKIGIRHINLIQNVPTTISRFLKCCQ